MPTTIHNTGITFPDATTQTTAAAAGGEVQTQLFTAPGTWTKPASCTQVRVWVVGGGAANSGPATSGGTSSFGPAVSATGGSVPANGAGTVSVGTALKTGSLASIAIFTGTPNQGSGVFFGGLAGLASSSPINTNPTPNLAYSTSTKFMAGASGGSDGVGLGGIASAIVPVSAPVTVTVGASGSPGPTATLRPCGGAVLVEFVG